jgi:hypothetical protein
MFQVHPHGFMVRIGGESGKYFDCPILRLGGKCLFPLSSHKLFQIRLLSPSLFASHDELLSDQIVSV